MIVIVGCLVVLGAVMAGFTLAGGHAAALIQPSEFVTIGGAALGALIVMSPVKVLKDLVRGMIQSIKGSPYNKQTYVELFKLSYQLLRVALQDGVIALESHVTGPGESEIFRKYPRIAGNHHAVQFLCGGLVPILEGTAKPEQIPAMLENSLSVMQDEHHAPLNVLTKTADALPGFGIVAAVLGIVITMGSIDGPVEQVGEKVGAALVGTFLGILLSYGFFSPLSVRMEFLGDGEMAFFRVMSVIVEAFAFGTAPKVAIESACRRMGSDIRLGREELDQLFADAEKP
jgi:chemotaxis protein MotA